MRYVYRVGEGWLNGLEPRNNLCRFNQANMDHHTRPTYDFTDIHSTGKPIRIHGKAHWRRHLKEHGLTDDTNYSTDTLDRRDRERAKLSDSARQGIRSAISDAIRIVKDRPYSTIGKSMSSSELKSQLVQARRVYERSQHG